MFRGIDLFSDTVTRPSLEMRRVIADAEVGDEQQGEDPTTRRLEERLADCLGKERTMFFPSATMANQIALRLHCRPGDEILGSPNCHIFTAEAGGPAVHAHVMARPLPSERGVFTGDAVRAMGGTERGPHYSRSRLVIVENTANMDGGVAWPWETLQSVWQAARETGLQTHLDGARIFNAATALGRPVRDLTEPFDTVTVCLSKGLGCPAGAVLGFAGEHYREIRRLKQLMGGAMRQSGILAAAGLYALDHNVGRLAEDHENARQLARGLARFETIRVETPEPSTNMVFFHWTHRRVTPEEFDRKCRERGLRLCRVGGQRFRAVTHLDVSREDIDNALKIVEAMATSPE